MENSQTKSKRTRKLKTQSKIEIFRFETERLNVASLVSKLQPDGLASILNSFNNGYIEEGAKLFYAIQNRDDTVVSVTQKRKLATASLPWEILKFNNEGKEDLASQQAIFLEEFYNNIVATSALDENATGSLSMVIENMLDCLGSKFSVHETIWNPTADKLTVECKYAPLWYFTNQTGKLHYKESYADIYGTPLDNNWMVCCYSKSLMEATSVAYLIKRLAIGDWSVFSARFGSAFPLLKSSATPESKEWYEASEMISNFANEQGLMISERDSFDLIQANANGLPMPALVERMDRAIAMIWRGSDLATLSRKDGAGSSLQGEETNVLERGDCIKIEECLHANLSIRALRWAFGEKTPILCYITLRKKEKKDLLQQLTIIERAAELGCPISKDNAYEILELAKPKEGEALINLNKVSQQTSDFANSSKIEDSILSLAEAMSEDLEPVLAKLDKMAKTSKSTEEYNNRLNEFNKRLSDFYEGGKNEQSTWEEILKKEFDSEK